MAHIKQAHIKHFHSSGRYNRTGASLRAATKKYITAGAHLITYTETERQERKTALRGLENFYLITGNVNNRDDCSILFDVRFLRVIHTEQFKLSDASFVLGGHQTPPSYACIAVFEDIRTQKRFVVAVYHTPSSVQHDLANKTQRLPRTKAWWINTRSLRNRVNHLKREYKCAGALIVCDWNLDFFLLFARAIIKSIYPAWTMTWTGHMPSSGTMGNRLIDASLIKGQLKRISIGLFVDDDSSDHRPYEETLSL